MLLNKNDSLMLLVDVQEKLVSAVLHSEDLIKRCDWLLKLAVTLNVPILASEQYPQGLGSTIMPLRTYFNHNGCIAKIHFSCMQESAYVQRLKAYSKKQLVLFGIEAHVCVMQTAMELHEAGFDVFVVVDAVSSRNEIDLKYGLKRMKQEHIHLITSEMVFFEWLRQAGTPEFKKLSKAFLQ